MANWDDDAALEALEQVEQSRRKGSSASNGKATQRPGGKSSAKKNKSKGDTDDYDDVFESEDNMDDDAFEAEDDDDEEEASDEDEDDEADSDADEESKPAVSKKARTSKQGESKLKADRPKTKTTAAKKKTDADGGNKPTGSPKTSVLDYLKQKNRPYSAAVLVPNLGNELSMVKMKKILDEAVKSGDLWESGDGAKVYFPNQDKMPEASPTEMDKFKKQIQQLEEDVQALQKQRDARVAKVARLEAAPPDKDVGKVMKELQDAVDVADGELTRYKTRLATMASDKPLVVADLKTQLEFWSYHAKKQQQVVVGGLRTISEPSNRDWKDLADEAGVLVD